VKLKNNDGKMHKIKNLRR